MKSLSSKKEEPKVCENAYEQGSVQALARRRTCHIWSYGFGFRGTDTKKGLGNLHLLVWTTFEVRHVSGVFLNGGSEKAADKV